MYEFIFSPFIIQLSHILTDILSPMRWEYTILWTCKFLKGRNRLLYLLLSLLFQKRFLSVPVYMSVKYMTPMCAWQRMPEEDVTGSWELLTVRAVPLPPTVGSCPLEEEQSPQLLSHASSFSVCSFRCVTLLQQTHPFGAIFSQLRGPFSSYSSADQGELFRFAASQCLSLPPPWKKVSLDIEYNVCSFSLFSSSVLQKTPYSLWLLKFWMWHQCVWVIVPSCVSCSVPWTICLSLSLS